MSRTKTEECKYPCVYTVNSKSEPSFFYSSKQDGHFGVPKLIWSNGGNPGSYVDINGDYGLTQFAYAIVDKPENLPKIKEVFDTKDFRNLMELSTFGQGHINYKVISIFKKDFWKVFLDNKDETKTEDEVVEPKKTVLVPATEAIEDVSIAMPSPIPKKKRTIKKRHKLILIESSDDTVVPEKSIEPNTKKIFNPLTNRHVKNTSANRKKIEKQSLKRGGKSKKKTRKNKGNK
jgi:hypothetical protein